MTTVATALSDDEIERYSRQILVPGIGAEGQQRLLGARVLVAGSERGVAQASLYLRAAGVPVVAYDPVTASQPVPHAVVVAGVEALPAHERAGLAALGCPVCWYLLRGDGFVSGVHPGASLPIETPAANASETIDETLHDAAACDAAAAACALICGLPLQRGPHSCPVA